MDEGGVTRGRGLQHRLGRRCRLVSVFDLSLAGNGATELSGNMAVPGNDRRRLWPRVRHRGL